ncbi:hypothetical protein Leryth_013099 [Lithospermum erythrorhizon]|nr:hypothetical protein Leryth_013099 [Lithospermum erythrorhizon]
MLYFPTHNEKFGKIFDIYDPDHDIPTYANPVPTAVLPTVAFDAEVGYNCFLMHSSRFKETNVYIINTFSELEQHAVNTLASDKRNPPVYTVGPLLDLKNSSKVASSERESIMKWLDAQHDSSVVYLCFGSWGGFELPQWPEILVVHEANNTKDTGMICGWSPQVDVLAHQAIGGFVSHCSWNSTLESLWNGVPIATWPIYAEQQLNAFELVKELGLAIDLKSDHRHIGGAIVGADEIEKAVRSLMDKDNPARKIVLKMKEKCRHAVAEGGSSYYSMGCFIDKVMEHKLTM